MSRRRCCCEEVTSCSCPSNSSKFVVGSCGCDTFDCDSPPAGLAGCCTQVFTIDASLEGLLYSPASYSNCNVSDVVTVDEINDIWYPGAPPTCIPCQGAGPCTAGATADDYVAYQQNWPCCTPGSTVRRFKYSPTNCNLLPRVTAERYAPAVCLDANNCWVNPYMERFVPTSFHGTFQATFKWTVKAGNTRTPTACTAAGVYATNANIQKLTATSDCGMTNASYDIVCTTIQGIAYFVITIIWTPMIDAVVRGPSFGGNPCSGINPPGSTTLANAAWGTTFGSSAIGCSPVPTNGIGIRYRMAVAANPANQPCGIRLGKYDSYEIVNPLYFTDASLKASPSAQIS